MARVLLAGPQGGIQVVGAVQSQLSLPSVSFPAGAVVAGNTFGFAMTGDYVIDAALGAYGCGSSKQFTVVLFNETTGATINSYTAAAPSPGSETFSFRFGLTVANIAHRFSLRISAYGAGDPNNLINIDEVQVLVSSFSPQADEVTIIQNPDGTISAIGGLIGTTDAVDPLARTLLGFHAGTSIIAPGVENTIVGFQAGEGVTVGAQNVLMGFQAANALDNGTGNCVFGYEAGYVLTSGDGNVFIGWQAGLATNADNNVFVGYSAGAANTTAAGNVFVGYHAGAANTVAAGNVAVGFTALGASSNAASANNTVLGNGALSLGDNANLHDNVAVGYNAGLNCTGASNVIIGSAAGDAVTGGSSNVCVGTNAGTTISTGIGNVCIGTNAGAAQDTNNVTTFVGYYAGAANTAANNTFIGSNAGEANVAGANNTAVGKDAFLISANAAGSNNTVLGANALSSANAAGLHDNVVVGYSAGTTCSGAHNVIVGASTAATLTTGTANIIMGSGADVAAAATSNAFVAGSNTAPVNNVYFGKGMVNAAATAYTINGTGGTGNNAGADINVAAGAGTGAGVAGSIHFKIANTGAAAGTTNTLYDRCVLTAINNAGVSSSYNDSELQLLTGYAGALNLQTISEEITIGTPGPTTDSTSDLLPANAYVVGVTARVTVILPGAVTWKMGTAGVTDQFAEALQPGAAGTLTTTWNTGHVSPGGPTAALLPFINTVAAKIRITTSGDPGAATGKVRVTVFFFTLTAPGS